MDFRILLAAGCILMFSYTEVTAENYKPCKELYRRYSASHSYCQPKNPNCDIVKQGALKYKKEILELHNRFRSIMAQQKKGNRNWPAAADMMELEWDDELAAVAQKRADQCIYGHDKNEQRKVQRFNVGQNIADIYDSEDISTPDWEKAVTAWFGEIDLLKPEQLCGERDLHHTGHFTALVWGKTFKVGCGYTQYKHDNLYDELYFCNYGPGGNFDKVCIYEPGPACSKCPENTKCDKTLGLCKRDNTNEYPTTKTVDKEKYIFHCDFRNPKSEDCGFHHIGKGTWNVYNSLDNGYLETILKPGENGTIIFSKKIMIPEEEIKEQPISFCIRWRYRKGPNYAKDQANNLAKVFISPVVPNQPTPILLTYELDENNQAFILDGATFHWPYPTEVKVSFEVPKGAEKQYFNLNAVYSYMGRCKND